MKILNNIMESYVMYVLSIIVCVYTGFEHFLYQDSISSFTMYLNGLLWFAGAFDFLNKVSDKYADSKIDSNSNIGG